MHINVLFIKINSWRTANTGNLGEANRDMDKGNRSGNSMQPVIISSDDKLSKYFNYENVGACHK